MSDGWWSVRFLAVLERVCDRQVLAAGRRAYAGGEVLSLTVEPGRVSGMVSGRRVRPYRAQLIITPFTTAQWRRIEKVLASQGLFAAELAAGNVPVEIEDAFDTLDLPLFPDVLREMRMTCECGEVVVPCRHLAALCYRLADAFGHDPFLIFAWRGRERDELVPQLAALRRSAAAPPAGGEAAELFPGAGLIESSLPQEQSLKAYYAPSAPLPSGEAEGPSTSDLVLSEFPMPEIVVRRRPVATYLATAYAALGEGTGLFRSADEG